MIYAISDGWAVKIGHAKPARLGKRVKELQIGNPRRIRLIAACVCDGEVYDAALESLLHKKIADGHIRGEWYLSSKDSVQALVCGMWRKAYEESARLFGEPEDITDWVATHCVNKLRTGKFPRLLRGDPLNDGLDDLTVDLANARVNTFMMEIAR